MACSHIDSTLSIFSFCRPLLEPTVFSHTRRKAMFFIRKWGPVFEGAEHAWTWWLRWWQIGWARSKEQVKGKEVGRFFGSRGSSFFGGQNAKRGRTEGWVFLKKGFSEKGFLCLGRKLPEDEFFWKRGFLRRFLFFLELEEKLLLERYFQVCLLSIFIISLAICSPLFIVERYIAIRVWISYGYFCWFLSIHWVCYDYISICCFWVLVGRNNMNLVQFYCVVFECLSPLISP